MASRGDILAATAFLVGAPQGLADQALAISGLSVYPGAVTVTAVDGARQILLANPLAQDVSQAASGTRYFSSDPSIIEITPDGRILGRAPGEAIVTAIHRMAESRILVKVDAPRTGPVTVGTNGGVVAGDGGLTVAVAPGALAGNTTVSIASADPATFGIPLPPADQGWTFGGAFHLDVGDDPMAVAAQLAIPTGLAAGTQVIFYRVIDVPAPDGSMTRGWLETESGVVDANGIARTASPPYPGITGSGDYVALGITPGQIVRANITLEDIANVSWGFFQAAQAMRPLMSFSPILGVTMWAAASAAAMSVLSFPPGQHTVTVRALAPTGQVFDSVINNVEVREGASISLRSGIVADFDPAQTRPQMTAPAGQPIAEVGLVDVGSGLEPILTIRGSKLLWAPTGAPAITGHVLGTENDDVKVVFRAGGREVASATVIESSGSGDAQVIRVRVPPTVAIGTVTFEVKRTGYTLMTRPDGTPLWMPFTTESSDAMRIEPAAQYVFAAGGGADNVLAISMKDGAGYQANEIVARIPVGDEQSEIPWVMPDGSLGTKVDVGVPNVPRAVAVTGDNTRAYVTLRGIRANGEGTGIAVVDAMTLQQIDAVRDVDTQPWTEGIQYIELNAVGTRPFWLAVDDVQKLLYVGDEGYYNTPTGEMPTGGRLYVVDIDPSSETYHQHIGTLTTLDGGVERAKEGFRGMVMASGGQLLLTAPDNKWQPGDPDRRTVVKPGKVLVVDVRNMREQLLTRTSVLFDQIIDAGPEPYGISATGDPDKMIFTNRSFDGDIDSPSPRPGGIGLLTRTEGSRTWDTHYLDLTLGSTIDALDVNSAQGVVVTQDLKYAFVTGFNRFFQGVPSSDPDVSRRDPAGGNVGIIRDPFGIFPSMAGKKGLVAATRQIPWSNPDNLTLSSDGGTLFVAYTGLGQVAAYSVTALIDAVEMVLALPPENWPEGHPNFQAPLSFYNAINNFTYDEDGIVRYSTSPTTGDPIIDSVTGLQLETAFGVPMYRATNGILLFAPNTAIDVKADYRMPIDRGTTTFANFDPARAPINGGILVRGLAAQQSVIELLGPAPSSTTAVVTAPIETDDVTPTFEWKIGGRPLSTKVYISAFPAGDGLFPSDTPTADRAKYFGGDMNRNRIYSGTFEPPASGDIFSFDLPDEFALTRGNTYYFGVELELPDGRVEHRSNAFKVKALEVTGDQFASVVLITHGWQMPFMNGGGTASAAPDFAEAAKGIARATGGLAASYDPATGNWLDIATGAVANFASFGGKPVFLIGDWSKEAAISDSGFSEGAADAMFGSLAHLLTADAAATTFRASPWHLIGFSRGTSVTGEIAQRLGTYFPTGTNGPAQLQVTMLDPHDFAQKSLDVPIAAWLPILAGGGVAGTGLAALLAGLPPGAAAAAAGVAAPFFAGTASMLAQYAVLTGNGTIHYGDFKDPEIQRWANVTFFDNYYQRVANPTGIGFTPNGRAIPGADINLDLTGRSGFTRDDMLLGFGVGSTHMRVKSWYAGTALLDLGTFPSPQAATIAPDTIWRRGVDRFATPQSPFAESLGGAGETAFNAMLSGFDKVYVPWYRAHESETSGARPPASVDTASWEGVGAGWFYSVLGGGGCVPADGEHGPRRRYRQHALRRLGRPGADGVQRQFPGEHPAVVRTLPRADPGARGAELARGAGLVVPGRQRRDHAGSRARGEPARGSDRRGAGEVRGAARADVRDERHRGSPGDGDRPARAARRTCRRDLRQQRAHAHRAHARSRIPCRERSPGERRERVRHAARRAGRLRCPDRRHLHRHGLRSRRHADRRHEARCAAHRDVRDRHGAGLHRGDHRDGAQHRLARRHRHGRDRRDREHLPEPRVVPRAGRTAAYRRPDGRRAAGRCLRFRRPRALAGGHGSTRRSPRCRPCPRTSWPTSSRASASCAMRSARSCRAWRTSSPA